MGFPSVISVAELRSHTGRDLLSENDLDDLCEQRERSVSCTLPDCLDGDQREPTRARA